MAKNSIFQGGITPIQTVSIKQAYDAFVDTRKAKGCAKATIKGYIDKQNVFAKYIDPQTPVYNLNKLILQKMVLKMQESDLSDATISTYVRTFSTFLGYCREEGYTKLHIDAYKAEETVKETYTDAELKRLLKKPDLKKCDFTEFRTWVIVNLLVNSGMRAATIREIRIKDIDIKNGFLLYRHTKSRKQQIVPLCSEMVNIIKLYLKVRKGNADDYLFVQVSGEKLTDRALNESIRRYNLRRGVTKTSTHLFRHTFAKMFLLDCGGDAFRLQKLLGHSTLAMTKRYCNLFNADILRNYDAVSPLHKLYTEHTGKPHTVKMHPERGGNEDE